MKFSCLAAAAWERLGFGFVFLPLCNYFPHSLKSCWNGRSTNMYPGSSPHVLALGDTTTGISCCVLEEPDNLCRNQGLWGAWELGTAMEKLLSWGHSATEPVQGWEPPGAAESGDGVELLQGSALCSGASRLIQHQSHPPSASMVARGSWKNQVWPLVFQDLHFPRPLAVFDCVTQAQYV